ncbi:RHS repeat-associated core domain-containing protein, partial [Sphingobacterium thalpophilum]|uniref:RHS repeat domain-containing protein n=1 Tax=Sphingobacterium thalpophilum TaxID=259 RepID=UPI0031D8202B
GTTVLGNYTYSYQANTNRLTSVSSYADYTYDAVGQLASQVKGSSGMYLDYDVSGKVTKIYSDAAKQTIMLSFVYDDDGNRVMKKDHRTGAVTWYSYDGEGTLVAVFEQQGTGAIQLKEQPIYGSGRLGTYYRQGNNYQYTVTDHLGNTRVVINRNKTAGGSADIVYYADYYPFGMEVRSGGIENRYGYQGLYAEKDKETGWNSFELRNYDAAIGRWLTTDPYGQYHSPYVGMGNNPMSGIDKDGGAVEPPDIIYKNSYTNQEIARIKLPGRDVTIFTEAFRAQDIFPAASPGPVLSTGLSISATESYRRENLYYLRQNLANPDFNDLSRASTSFAVVANIGEGVAGELATLKFGQLYKHIWSLRSSSTAAKTGTEGGLNLFKFGKPTTTTAEGWKTGDRMLKMFDQGSPKLNWKQNSGFLRREMRSGNPIFDSYRYPNGQQIPTGGFLNAERKLLESRGWIYNPSTGAYHP